MTDIFEPARKKVLIGLDIATITGVAIYQTGQNIILDTWDLKAKRGESPDIRIIKFRKFLKLLIAEYGLIDAIAYERPAGRFPGQLAPAFEMIGQLKLLCLKKNIPFFTYSAAAIKKFATGAGNASKKDMIKAAVNAGYDTQDDNQADALFILKMLINEFEL